MNHDYGKCHVCGSRIEERCIDHTIRQGEGWLLVRGVPTGVCIKCGEQVLPNVTGIRNCQDSA